MLYLIYIVFILSVHNERDYSSNSVYILLLIIISLYTKFPYHFSIKHI